MRQDLDTQHHTILFRVDSTILCDTWDHTVLVICSPLIAIDLAKKKMLDSNRSLPRCHIICTEIAAARTDPHGENSDRPPLIKARKSRRRRYYENSAVLQIRFFRGSREQSLKRESRLTWVNAERWPKRIEDNAERTTCLLPEAGLHSSIQTIKQRN
jgi:hypothetical protein